jgi:hypothetical protein
MVELTRRALVLAKIETTYATDPTPTTAANAVEVIDLTLKPIKTPVERLAQHESLMRKPSIGVEEYYEIGFKLEISSTGTPGLPPRLGPLLRACGMSETIITGGSPVVKYRDRSSSFESCTIWAYLGGRLHKINGVFGNVKGVFEAGKFAMLEFSMMGMKGATPAITSMPTDAVYDEVAGDVQVCKNGTFTYNGKTTLVAQLMDFDLANTVVKRPSLSATYAIAGFEITDRNPVASINPETTIVTSYDFYGDALVNQRDLSYDCGDFLVTIPKFNPYNPEFEDSEGILRDKINGQISESTSDGYSIELQFQG